MAITSESRQLSLAAYVSGTRVTAPLAFEFVPPEGSFKGLTVRGTQLLRNLRPAVLLLHPRDSLPENTPPVTWRKATGDGLLVVDEFWSAGQSPGGTESLSDLLLEATNLQTRHVNTQSVSQDALQELKKFALIERALRADSSVILWSVGTTDIQAGAPPAEVVARIRFLAEATLAHNKLPVLATIPPSADADATEMARLRQVGIALKELGLKLHIPIVDLYSKSLAEPDVYAAFFETAHANIDLQHPNDAGRRWFARLVHASLLQYHEALKEGSHARP